MKRIALTALLALGLQACGDTADETPAAADTQSAAPSEATAAAPVPTGPVDMGPHGDIMGDLILGDPDAPVEIIEYASLTCPHCAQFHAEALTPIKKKYIETGQVKYIYRHFILNRYDLTASMIARCAGPKKYYDVMDLFFRRQRDWLNDNYLDNLKGMARRIGMGEAEVSACLANADMQKMLIASTDGGKRDWQVNSTPTIIINGEKQEPGAIPFERMEKLIDARLD